MTIILGIDPGSRMTGVGVIKKEAQKVSFIACKTIKTPDGDMSEKLQSIFDGITEYMSDYKPEEVAIEAVFMHKNPQSALKLGQARGVAIVAAKLYQGQVFEYSPKQIKQAVVGYGSAQKAQVQHMVRQLLSLSKVPQTDAADALAVAVCHAHSNSKLYSLTKTSRLRRGRIR